MVLVLGGTLSLGLFGDVANCLGAIEDRSSPSEARLTKRLDHFAMIL